MDLLTLGHPGADSLAWLAALVVTPALLGLLLLMQLLEDKLVQRFVGDEIATAIATTESPDELERLVATVAERLFQRHQR